MIISNFTVPELEYFRQNCNFIGYEVKVFDYRSDGMQLKQIAEILDLDLDNVKKISQRVNKKIIKVL